MSTVTRYLVFRSSAAFSTCRRSRPTPEAKHATRTRADLCSRVPLDCTPAITIDLADAREHDERAELDQEHHDEADHNAQAPSPASSKHWSLWSTLLFRNTFAARSRCPARTRPADAAARRSAKVRHAARSSPRARTAACTGGASDETNSGHRANLSNVILSYLTPVPPASNGVKGAVRDYRAKCCHLTHHLRNLTDPPRNTGLARACAI